MQSLVNRLPLLVSILILALFVFVMYLQLAPLFETQQTPPAANVTTQESSVEQTIKEYDIASFKLFGDATAKPKPAKQETKDLPKTTLRLTLRGVSAGFGDNANSALIEGPDASTLMYKVGEQLPGNASLHNIYDDRVVLERNGRLENLYFPAVSKGGGPLISSVATPQDYSNQFNAQPVSIPTNVSQPTVSPARSKSIKDRLDAIRKRIRANQQ